MALTDGAVILPGNGYVFVGPDGAAPPVASQAELDALSLTGATIGTGTTYKNLGHTSRENNVALSKDGGDVTVKSSWQNDSLRTQTAPVVWSISLNALQMDNDVLTYYFGGGDITATGIFKVLSTATSLRKALFLVMVDGGVRTGLHVRSTSITSDDAPEFDPENLVEFALSATFLGATGQPLMAWYRAGLGT